MRSLVFLAALLFGLGLVLSGMTNPEKVQGFLDVTGAWDPTLLVVMAAAVGVHAVGARLVLRKEAPIHAEAFSLPPRSPVDGRLAAGAALFGAGWGLAGYCPGPALVSASAGGSALVFTAAMLAGVALHQLHRRRRARESSTVGSVAARETP